jgi:hypothetical protein
VGAVGSVQSRKFPICTESIVGVIKEGGLGTVIAITSGRAGSPPKLGEGAPDVSTPDTLGGLPIEGTPEGIPVKGARAYGVNEKFPISGRSEMSYVVPELVGIDFRHDNLLYNL